ncbi:hypothetical protein M3196_13900 [Fictibacillus nanhaiensis]|uniref:hypothetical protein n=1 Tax=Fictibacillus nanhaiensis TaxID=742169 RepID=UPI00203FAAA8|nr:hypothetical protein [Fictibacillus nanhaiensis]MCM3732743.1 hypothetical protein [Fictibacillus nanhaiensis]
MHELSKHHEWMYGYLELINKHQRLIEVDIAEIVDATKKPLEALEQQPTDTPEHIYGAVFGALLRAIELNNSMSRNHAEELTGYKVSQRISFTFRLLRLLDKTYAKTKGAK